MIRISAIGGLGNQLFIWNLAHLLEARYGCAVKIYYPKKGTDRQCEISKLVKLCEHNIEVVENNKLSNGFSVLNRLERKTPFIAKILSLSLSIVQTKLPAESFLFSDKPPRFISGYFQSTALVEKAWPLYRAEILAFTETIIQKSRFSDSEALKRKMLHIRRGDFVKNKQTVGLLAIEYFLRQLEPREAVTVLTDAESSDSEISTKFPNALIYGVDTIDTWTSFSMLSRANYLITSNSTFSWWAGILSFERGGVVIAPRPWTITNIYGENYLDTVKFDYRESIFEQDNLEGGYSWK